MEQPRIIIIPASAIDGSGRLSSQPSVPISGPAFAPVVLPPPGSPYQQAVQQWAPPSAMVVHSTPVARQPESGPPMSVCGQFYPDANTLCIDPDLYVCAGRTILPSVFYIPPDFSAAVPLVGVNSGTTWLSGDFQTLGPLTRLRATASTWQGYAARPRNTTGIIPYNATASTSPTQVFTVYSATPAVNPISRAPSLGLLLQIGTTLYYPPSFSLGYTTSGYTANLGSGDTPPSVDRTNVLIQVAPFMYQGGWIWVPSGYRIDNDTGLLMQAGTYADPTTLTLTMPSQLFNSVYFTVAALINDYPLGVAVFTSVERWAAGRVSGR